MQPKDFLNTVISVHCLGRRIGPPTEGIKYGVELELEGRGVGLEDVATRGWNRHAEPSLRGEGMEFSTAGAKTLEEITKLLNSLFKKFTEQGVKFNTSLRTSTHVHLNFADQPVKTVINFFALFTLLEELLEYYSGGEDRKGNHFCISSRDAEGAVGVLSDAIAKGTLLAFANDAYKYGACNLSSLFKFGTVEVRTMKGASTAEEVINWLNILHDMNTYARQMKSPVELIMDLSMLGAEDLLNKIFSPHNRSALMRSFPVALNLHYSLMEGARLVQVFAFQFDEEFKSEPAVKPGRPDLAAGRLPLKKRPGVAYTIYLPTGDLWSCYPLGRGHEREGFWFDGEPLDDAQRVYWNEGLQRFVCRLPNGNLYVCNWFEHPILGTEPFEKPQCNIDEDWFWNRGEEEPDWEPDFDEGEEEA